MNKAFKIILFLLGFVLALKTMSGFIDPDLGWHLRFGQNLWAGNFQYLDTYTWGYYGKPWVNHEWGTDLLYWPIYHNFGFWPIIIFFSFISWLSFVLINKLYFSKITAVGVFFSFLCFFSVTHILAARPAMFAPLFLIVVLWILEKGKNKLYLLAPILWLWSALHGSWILGFIVINIFIVGQVLQILLEKYFKHQEQNTWSAKELAKLFSWEVFSFLVLAINPYGIKIWQEVAGYFSGGYFKRHVTEWVSSYTYPVYWQVLIASAAAAFIVFLAWRKKRINLTQGLIFIAFFYAAWKYKRNGLFVALLCVPFFTGLFYEMKNIFQKTVKNYELWQKRFFVVKFVLIIWVLFLTGKYFLAINTRNNPFADKWFAGALGYPVEAAEVVKNYSGKKIFTEYDWGGYFNFKAQNNLIFIDGRGTATWQWDNTETVFEKYQKTKYEENGLKFLEDNNVDYILLKSGQVAEAPKPDLVNRILFVNQDLNKVVFEEVSALETDLRNSENWKLIYSDKMVNMWGRK